MLSYSARALLQFGISYAYFFKALRVAGLITYCFSRICEVNFIPHKQAFFTVDSRRIKIFAKIRRTTGYFKYSNDFSCVRTERNKIYLFKCLASSSYSTHEHYTQNTQNPTQKSAQPRRPVPSLSPRFFSNAKMD